MKIQMCAFLVLATCASIGFAQTRKLSIQSKLDQFDLLLTGNTGRVAGKPADLTAFRDLLPMLTNPIDNECTPLKGAPDAKITENGKVRNIYFKAGMITEGNNCTSVGGDGLLYFPVHRDFLIGPKNGAIPLQSPIKIFRQGVKLFELKKTDATWNAEGTDLLLNWDFLDRFQNSLSQYTIRFRVQKGPGQDKPKMVVQVGPQSYEFYKVTGTVWALKRPGSQWLEASDDWSFWYDFDNSVLEDRFTEQIRFLRGSGHDRESRLAAMHKIDTAYSRNIRDLYHHMILSVDEDEALKRLAFQRLRSKPTKETALVMARYLQVGESEEFKKTAGQILKINNPKGPAYNPNASAADRGKAVEFWTNWAQQTK